MSRRLGAINEQDGREGMATVTVAPNQMLERILSIEIVRVTERAAVSAARLRGRGKEKASDQAAVDAMRRELNKLPIDGTVVIGEGERDEAPMLFIGEAGRHQAAAPRSTSRSIRSKARRSAPRTCRARSPPWRWPKAARCSTHPTSTWRRSRSAPAILKASSISMRRPTRTSAALAKAKGVEPSGITALMLDRPRHADMIAAVRKTGAAVSLITDGDVAGVIHTADPPIPASTFISASAARPKACWRRRRCAASAARCNAGSCSTPRSGASAPRKMGITDPRKRYEIEDMVRGDCLFAATGVTTGLLLTGVKFNRETIETETVVMRSITGTVRWIRAEHRQLEKFHLD